MLIEIGQIRKDIPEDFAQFALNNPDLNPDKLGDFFGGDAEYNIQSLSIFTDRLNFKKQTLESALRKYLTYFTLPGEG